MWRYRMLLPIATAARRQWSIVECSQERGKGVPEQRKSRHEYLSHYGLDQAYVYVLVSGVVKASVTLREGEHFNIFYIQGPSPVSLLRDEVSSLAKSPYSVRVESEEAVYMAVPRIAFWST